MNYMPFTIAQRFDNASLSYDAVAGIQRKAAEFLADKILEDTTFSPKTLLDLGAGTGYLSALLISKLVQPHNPNYLNAAQCVFYLNDIAPNMLKMCREKFSDYPHVHYLLGSMLNLNNTLYDAIISNLAFQWLDDWKQVLHCFHAKSSQIFAFSTLVKGTFQTWENLLNTYYPIVLRPYPTATELIHWCQSLQKENQHFEYYAMDQSLFFENPAMVMRYLKMLGASAAGMSSDSILPPKILKTLLQLQSEEPLVLEYKIFFGIFRTVYK